jgi:hypothetical protein
MQTLPKWFVKGANWITDETSVGHGIFWCSPTLVMYRTSQQTGFFGSARAK